MTISESTMNAPWRQTTPGEVMAWLGSMSVPWWIGGAWALDLFLGRATRLHSDIDVGIFRRDSLDVRAALSAWEFFEAAAGRLTWIDRSIEPRRCVNSLWCRQPGRSEWAFELLLDEGCDDAWIFRRHAGIKRSLRRGIRYSAEGIPYLAPEIQLLYKSKHIRPKDEIDFDAVASRLDPEARGWLQSSIAVMDQHHPWLSKL